MGKQIGMGRKLTSNIDSRSLYGLTRGVESTLCLPDAGQYLMALHTVSGFC